MMGLKKYIYLMDHHSDHMKATAKAHPIQGLIKYHGLKDEELRIPYHDSISVCTGPISTVTTAEAQYDLDRDRIIINGEEPTDRDLQRVIDILERIREISAERVYFKVESKNDFQTNIGLGASSSGFAALAMAACSALDLGLQIKEISKIARLGAGSASRSVAGGFARWVAGDSDDTSYAYRLDSDLKMGMLAVVIPAFKSTEDAHRAVTTSPFFQARLDYLEEPLKEMERAIRKKDIGTVGWLAEMDTMNLHGITMTSVDEMFLWEPETVRVIQVVKQMRRRGMEVSFSIDTGATVYINTQPDNVQDVKGWLTDEGFKVLELEVAPGAATIDEHLF